MIIGTMRDVLIYRHHINFNLETGQHVYMSVITQDGESPLMLAASEGETEVVALLVKAGAALDLQNKVNRN